jgi:transcriptional regulator with XRE-family HTH domain
MGQKMKKLQQEMDGFPARLRLARRSKGLTQEELANLAYTTQKTISMYERGRGLSGRANLAIILRIVRVLKISPSWLFFDKR